MVGAEAAGVARATEESAMTPGSEAIDTTVGGVGSILTGVANAPNDGGGGKEASSGLRSFFVSHSQEKFHFPDGRRGIRFFLVDDAGNAIPAVLGEERDTRDG